MLIFLEEKCVSFLGLPISGWDSSVSCRKSLGLPAFPDLSARLRHGCCYPVQGKQESQVGRYSGPVLQHVTVACGPFKKVVFLTSFLCFRRNNPVTTSLSRTVRVKVPFRVRMILSPDAGVLGLLRGTRPTRGYVHAGA